MAIGMITDNDASKRESLLSILKDVSPNTDNYLTTNLGVVPAATQPLTEWVTYNTARPTSITFTAEGSDVSLADLTAPTRSNNRTAIIDEVVGVSDSEQATSVATGTNPLVFQKSEGLKRLKAKMEYALINGAYATGASGVARGMAGIDGCISTNVTARACGTSFTEDELNNIIQDSWDQVGAQYVADVLLCPMVIKRRIAGFTANLTRNIDASEKKLVNEVRVYDSQVGQTVMIIPHKDVRKAAGTLTVYALREDTFKMQFLKGREPQWEDMGKKGHYDWGMYTTEMSLVSLAQPASAKRTGYSNVLSL